MTESIVSQALGDSVKLYALMTPPAVLSAFLGHTKRSGTREKLKIASKTSAAIFIIGTVLYVWGSSVFELFGFTLDAFRIGSGVLLMLTAISLMNDEGADDEPSHRGGDISVVPLAIPLGMGPASIGAVMVMGAAARSEHELLAGVVSLFLASLGMFLLLALGDLAARVLRAAGIAILAKLTGLLLAAIAAQVIFTGISGFLGL